MSTAPNNVDILAFGLGNFREHAHADGAWPQSAVRILLLDPDFPSSVMSYARRVAVSDDDQGWGVARRWCSRIAGSKPVMTASCGSVGVASLTSTRSATAECHRSADVACAASTRATRVRRIESCRRIRRTPVAQALARELRLPLTSGGSWGSGRSWRCTSMYPTPRSGGYSTRSAPTMS
jgi:hypothetical protein